MDALPTTWESLNKVKADSKLIERDDRIGGAELYTAPAKKFGMLPNKFIEHKLAL